MFTPGPRQTLSGCIPQSTTRRESKGTRFCPEGSVQRQFPVFVLVVSDPNEKKVRSSFLSQEHEPVGEFSSGEDARGGGCSAGNNQAIHFAAVQLELAVPPVLDLPQSADAGKAARCSLIRRGPSLAVSCPRVALVVPRRPRQPLSFRGYGAATKLARTPSEGP